MNLLDVVFIGGIVCLFFNPILGVILIVGSLAIAGRH